MGSLSRMDGCQRIIEAVAEPYLQEYSLPPGQYELVRQNLAEEREEVCHVVTMRHMETSEEFELVAAPLFDPEAFGLVEDVADTLRIEQEEAKRLLQSTGVIEEEDKGDKSWA